MLTINQYHLPTGTLEVCIHKALVAFDTIYTVTSCLDTNNYKIISKINSSVLLGTSALYEQILGKLSSNLGYMCDGSVFITVVSLPDDNSDSIAAFVSNLLSPTIREIINLPVTNVDMIFPILLKPTPTTFIYDPLDTKVLNNLKLTDTLILTVDQLYSINQFKSIVDQLSLNHIKSIIVVCVCDWTEGTPVWDDIPVTVVSAIKGTLKYDCQLVIKSQLVIPQEKLTRIPGGCDLIPFIVTRPSKERISFNGRDYHSTCFYQEGYFSSVQRAEKHSWTTYTYIPISSENLELNESIHSKDKVSEFPPLYVYNIQHILDIEYRLVNSLFLYAVEEKDCRPLLRSLGSLLEKRNLTIGLRSFRTIGDDYSTPFAQGHSTNLLDDLECTYG